MFRDRGQSLPNLDPVLVVGTAEKSLELVSTTESRRSVVHVGWQVLEQAQRHISATEAQPLEQETTGHANTNLVGSPVLQTEACELLNVL